MQLTWFLNRLLALRFSVLQLVALSVTSKPASLKCIQRRDNSTNSETGWTSTVICSSLFFIISMIVSRGRFSTETPFTLISRSPGKSPVVLLLIPEGSANITGWNDGAINSFRYKQIALRKLNPKSFRGFWRLIIRALGGGSWSNLIGGSGKSTPSNVCTRDQRLKLCDSPTGLIENGGVTNDEFVVSVKLSALGDADVIITRFVDRF